MDEYGGRSYPGGMRVPLCLVGLVLPCLMFPSCASDSLVEPSLDNQAVTSEPDPEPVSMDPEEVHLRGLDLGDRGTWTLQTPKDQNYVMLWRVLDGPIQRNEYLELEVRFYRQGEPLDGLELAVLGWMPDHEHGFQRRTSVEPMGPGLFRVTGVLFHMRGTWELTFDVAQAARVDKLVFGVEL